MATSDEAARGRLQIAGDLARIETAKRDIVTMLALLEEVDARTIKPHYCHVCGRKTREKE